jgi:hypothetical protein
VHRIERAQLTRFVEGSELTLAGQLFPTLQVYERTVIVPTICAFIVTHVRRSIGRQLADDRFRIAGTSPSPVKLRCTRNPNEMATGRIGANRNTGSAAEQLLGIWPSLADSDSAIHHGARHGSLEAEPCATE